MYHSIQQSNEYRGGLPTLRRYRLTGLAVRDVPIPHKLLSLLSHKQLFDKEHCATGRDPAFSTTFDFFN